MDDGLKQRMIGAMVLLALGIIFLPAFFDRERVSPVDRTSQIPTSPQIERLPVVELAVLEKDKQELVPENAFLPDESKPEPITREESGQAVDTASQTEAGDLSVNKEAVLLADAKKYDGIVDAWVLQFASYQSRDRAKQMEQELSKAGYDAYLRNVKTRSGETTRLYVGPKINKQQLVDVQKALNTRYGVKTLLLKFEP